MKISDLSSSTMISPFFLIISLLFFSSCSVVDGSIRVRVETDFGASGENLEKSSVLSYSVVNEWNDTLFAGGDLAVFVSGVWCVAPSQFSALRWRNRLASQPLLPSSQETVNGTIPGLGNYEGIRILWDCDLSKEFRRQRRHGNNSNNNFQVITSFLNFESNRAVLFDIEYPVGAENTSLVVFNQTDGDLATLATFPSFVTNNEAKSKNTDEIHEEGRNSGNPKSSKTDSYFPPTFPSALSWEGTFIQGVRRLSIGPRGGPTVFFNSSDPALANVVVASPFFDVKPSQTFSSSRHHFNQFTAGNNLDWSGNIPSFSPGRSGRLASVPSESSQSILMYQGSKGGITSTIQEWGGIMQTASQAGITTDLSLSADVSFKTSQERKRFKRPKLDDLTLEQIGYQTDNGAMYCFCDQANCSEVLLEEKEYLDSVGIPIGYLSFQGAGSSSGRGKAAPWCVEKWSADDGQDRNKYPIDTKDFQKALGVPLQLYAPYFCPNTTGYFQPDTPWKSLSSNPELPGCSNYNFETAGASDSKVFFEWFLTKGIENAGMVSFESDFMNQNANCVDEFVENPIHGFDEFLQGMADAALGLGVPIQWCMASPNLAMASLNYPAVTNFRVSFDYCYGGSYDIGESSLLVWAVGASPSKDTLWTTDNNRTETPGCDWTVDHEAVAAELHVVLALMSTGPVGISDAIGMTNVTLVKRIISNDGSLLQPSKPITAVDSSFLAEDLAPNGFVYGTYGLDLSWIFVSFQLRDPFPVTRRDFWPPLEATEIGNNNNVNTPIRLIYRTFGSSEECIDGEDAIASGCVKLVTLKNDSGDLSPVFEAPQSSFDSPGSDLAPNVVTVWKECPEGSGVFFLGELNKYVAISPKRFQSVECNEEGVLATVRGGLNEVIEVTLLVQQEGDTWYKVVKEKITISDSQRLEQFHYRTNNVAQHYSGHAANEITADALKTS